MNSITDLFSYMEQYRERFTKDHQDSINELRDSVNKRDDSDTPYSFERAVTLDMIVEGIKLRIAVNYFGDRNGGAKWKPIVAWCPEPRQGEGYKFTSLPSQRNFDNTFHETVLIISEASALCGQIGLAMK